MPIGKNDFHSFESSIAINTEMSEEREKENRESWRVRRSVKNERG